MCNCLVIGCNEVTKDQVVQPNVMNLQCLSVIFFLPPRILWKRSRVLFKLVRKDFGKYKNLDVMSVMTFLSSRNNLNMCLLNEVFSDSISQCSLLKLFYFILLYFRVAFLFSHLAMM